jgi:hypothetical protein
MPLAADSPFLPHNDIISTGFNVPPGDGIPGLKSVVAPVAKIDSAPAADTTRFWYAATFVSNTEPIAHTMTIASVAPKSIFFILYPLKYGRGRSPSR